MKFTTDNRGVSEVIGAILVFGVLIALLAILQTQAIPAANQQVEFDHNQEVQGDLIKFHQTASEVATTGEGQSVRVKTGTGYPSRLLFYSPPSATGQLSTTENRTVTITNASATEPEVNDYMTGSNNLTLPSRNLRYSVNYNYLDDAPTTRYEYGILYNNFSDATIIENPGSVIDDTDINLVFMAGNYSESGGLTQSMDVRPVSSPSRPVTIEGEGGDNITLELPSQLSLTKWEEIVGSQNTVLNVSKPTSDTVRIDLDGSERYTLRMSRLGLEPGVEKPEPHYIVPAEDGTASVGVGQTTNAKYEVRDQYNNPVSGADVDVEHPNGTTITETTDGSGRIAIPITPNSGGTTPVNAELNTTECQTTSLDRCEATFNVQVSDLSINPGSGARLVDAEIQMGTTLLIFPTNTNVLTTTFETTDSGTTRQIESLRVNHYSGSEEPPDVVNFYNGDSPSASEDPDIEDIEVGGPFYDSTDTNWNDAPEEITDSGTDYTFALENDDGSARDADDADFMVMTVVFENGERAVYFVSPN